MRFHLALALACAFGLLLNRSMADTGPLLFNGPPLTERLSAEVDLSAYQRPVQLPRRAYEEELPPVPVPMDEPDRFSIPEAEPVEAPVPETPAEPPVRTEGPAEPENVPDTPVRSQPRRAPPMIEKAQTQKTEPDTSGVELPEPGPIVTAAPHGFYYDEPMASCDGSRSPQRGFRMPCISCADLALPELPQPYIFDEFGLELGGWLEAGFSAADTSPGDRFNGPITFNDRHAEAQMNQLWFYLERKPDTWACSLDLGGRIDVMYGTDAQFIHATDGLESNWEQTDRFYKAALPQFYLDATLAGWTVRMGRFFTILGYETPAAPDNFFYSHAYTMQYGEPFTHTGMLVSRRFGDWLVNAGFHRGNDQFDDTDGLNALNLLGGFGYKAPGDWASVEYAFSSTENGPGVLSYTHSMVNTIRMTENFDYVLQGDYGQIWNGRLRRQVSWWGLNQYFTYKINPCWAAALRFEWFRDRDGGRVSGIRAGNQTPTGLGGNFYEITLGLNWLPRTNLRVRPEVRWDIFDPTGSTTNQAYDAGNQNRQFTFGCDVIYRF